MSWSITGTRGGAGGPSAWTGEVSQFVAPDVDPQVIADVRVAVTAAEALADAAVTAGKTTYPVAMFANGHREPSGSTSVSAGITVPPQAETVSALGDANPNTA